ncbi:class I SAM-dependent methyltransferase [Janthinobacterium sp. 17J80-10]|uniref:class I SAM-dependent methyltransferase n=1 Tax=Janthinobacterium sp. 17J80-10 TaxID=2497863 RepID=UPI0019D6C227|nr:class I SAM-dependent methyltransferase [Janthinobacterium sp. 17J80-10]
MLHVAPEACLTKNWKILYKDYVTVDLFAQNVKVRADVTELCFPNACFDAIVCNHVLEHVPDDAKALAELYRSLKPGGWGSIQVPVLGEITQEDASVTDPAERLLKFGQSDHVRQYGADFKQRLEQAGFIVLEISKTEFLDSEAGQRISAECENGVTLVIKPVIENKDPFQECKF